jgi:phosphoglycolate phosphatase-like HAD superfamily hydrolase
MRKQPLLVLDFDGVICDSRDECCLSSWIAYHELYRKNPAASVPLSLGAGFARLRPFIRTGGDFLVIQEALEEGRDIRDQKEFDALADKAGPQKMKLYKELFYQARSALLSEDRPFWLSLNRIYSHVFDALRSLPPEAPVRILSTKRPQFIVEIVDHAGLDVPRDHIHESGAEGKLPRVESLREESGCEKAVFIEDQIDNIRGNANPKVKVFLASWGYVKQEWLSGRDGVPVMTPEGFKALVEREYGALSKG